MNDYCPPRDHFSLLFQLALDLFRRPSPSGREDLVRAYVRDHLEQHGFSVSVDSAGNVLAVREMSGPQEGYPLLSFHMDCIYVEEWGPVGKAASLSASACAPRQLAPSPSSRYHSKRRRAARLSLRHLEALTIERGWLHSRGSFVLGGDDKCGASIALTLAATTDLPFKIVASVQEEIGCVGIEQVDPDFFEDVAYALVLDRRGSNHLIVSIAGHILCQGAFAAALMRAAAATGLVVYATEGAFSDALTLSHYVDNVANLSVGYYQPHSVEECVSLADLWHSYQWVYEALHTLPRQSSAYLRPRTHARGEEVVCPQCQKLRIPPTQFLEDLRAWLCRCPEEERDNR